jgi:hypothetical protein
MMASNGAYLRPLRRQVIRHLSAVSIGSARALYRKIIQSDVAIDEFATNSIGALLHGHRTRSASATIENSGGEKIRGRAFFKTVCASRYRQ